MAERIICTCDCELEETLGKHDCACSCRECTDKLTDEDRKMLAEARAELEELLSQENCHSCKFSFFMSSVIGAGLCRKNPPTNHVMPKPMGRSQVQRTVPAQQVEVVLHSSFPKIYRNFWCGAWQPGKQFKGEREILCCGGTCSKE